VDPEGFRSEGCGITSNLVAPLDRFYLRIQWVLAPFCIFRVLKLFDLYQKSIRWTASEMSFPSKRCLVQIQEFQSSKCTEWLQVPLNYEIKSMKGPDKIAEGDCVD
jgi:hypothetical protein